MRADEKGVEKCIWNYHGYLGPGDCAKEEAWKIITDKCLYFVFVDLDKAFDRVPWEEVVWWAVYKLNGGL